jgi:hypothetical protein
MRKIIVAALVLVSAMVTQPLEARRSYHHSSIETGSAEYYTNVSGHFVHRPMTSQSRPSGATAHCRDGSWSFSENHRGTCSHHGGVASWL